MIVGVPREVKNNESRVAATPAFAAELIKFGHKVYIQTSAGKGSGFKDEQYEKAGAIILGTPEEIYDKSELILKVKEPIAAEYKLIRPGQIIFTYFHFAASRELTEAMIKSRAICIAYETVEKSDKSLPLLMPMSEVAGRMAVQEGAKYLEKPFGGKGKLLGGVPGVKPAKVLVLGGGIVGSNAAKIAAGMGAHVIIMDISVKKLRELEDIMPKNVTTLMSNSGNLTEEIRNADLIVGAVLIPGAKAPHLIKKDMLKLMEPGTVIVDVAVDQGGCIETARPTTHENPVYEVDGILHYCVANMPGAVPVTSTFALTNATLPYALQIANKGWEKAIADNSELKAGLNIAGGNVLNKGVADTFHIELISLDQLYNKKSLAA
mgnify:CR=1 FL=1